MIKKPSFMEKKNIALVMGGFSGEHDISIASGNQVYGQLDHNKYNVYKIVVEREGWYWLDGEEHRPVDRGHFTVTDNGQTVQFDLAFIIIHGNPGENGVLQGYFDMLGIKYTTCGFYTSALTFQKGYCNPVVKSFGVVKVAESVLLYEEPDKQGIEGLLGRLKLPVFVKPAAGGSSVATTKVKTGDQLLPAIREAFTEDHAVLVEDCIVGRDFDCGVFRKADGEKLVFPITEIVSKNEFFDYEAKYTAGKSDEITPADLGEAEEIEMKATTAMLYDALECRGFVRMDYILSSDALYFIEANIVPGMSEASIIPKQAACMGVSLETLFGTAVEDALERGC